jgi:hypothetical protein
VAGYPYYAYDEDNAYQQYASQEQYRQWADYAAQQQYEDAAAQANYYNWAAANSYKQPKADVLKVASNKNTNKVIGCLLLPPSGFPQTNPVRPSSA